MHLIPEYFMPVGELQYTDKKENIIVLIYKEILYRRKQLQSHIWLTASSYMTKYLRISTNIRKPFLIYDFATDPIWISLYMRKIFFSFYQCTVYITIFAYNEHLRRIFYSTFFNFQQTQAPCYLPQRVKETKRKEMQVAFCLFFYDKWTRERRLYLIYYFI
jgi:hypothetical protein